MGSYIAFGVWYRRILILASVKQSDGLRVFPAPALPAHRRFLSCGSLGTRELALWELKHPCLHNVIMSNYEYFRHDHIVFIFVQFFYFRMNF